MKIVPFCLALFYSVMSVAKPIAATNQQVTPLLNGQVAPDQRLTIKPFR